MKFQLLIASIILVGLSACQSEEKQDTNTETPSKLDMTEPYTSLSNGFYKGDSGKIYIVTCALLAGEIEKTGNDFYREVPVADPEKYTKLTNGEFYANDGVHVYMDWGMTDGRHISILDSGDAASFESIGYRWGKDNRFVYNNGIILDGLKPDSMEILCPRSPREGMTFFTIVKDRNQVYYGTDLVPEADPASFECIPTDSGVYYQDKNWIYHESYFPNRDSSFRRKNDLN